MSNAGSIITETLRSGAARLGKGDWQQSPQRLCELLLCAILDCQPLDLYTRIDHPLTADTLAKFDAALERLASGEPLQYVTRTALFMERPFHTDARALIPRPETEILVRTVLECPILWETAPQARIVDAGTGSGCIAVSLILERPGAFCLAVDNSAAALELALENARLHGVEKRIVFMRGNGLTAMPQSELDAVISNPPYITTSDYERLPAYIRRFEPRQALDGGPDGLALIRTFARQAGRCLRPGGWLFMEIGHGQAEAAHQILRKAGFSDPRLTTDLRGLERVVWGRHAA